MKPQPDFSDIYDEHYPRVLSLCRYLLKSHEAGEDAAQEVFLKVRGRIDSYDPAFPMSNWLLKIASNHCIDLLRRQRTERRLLGWESPEMPEPTASGPGPLGQLLADERGDRVRSALETLPDKYRVPLVLAYYNEFSYDEVGAVMGLGRNTVATLLFRGKQMLRTRLVEREGYAS